MLIINTFDVALGAIVGYIFGFIVARVLTALDRKKEYKDRSIIKLKSHHIGGLKFKFMAKSMSENLVWLKSIELSSDSNVRASLVFDPQIFSNGATGQINQDMPAEFAGEVRISKVDAMVRIDNSWKECLVIVRGVKNDETDLEFFPETE